MDVTSIIEQLLDLDTEQQVTGFIELAIRNGMRWTPLGGDMAPSGLISTQPDPIKSLVERIVNMHDATIEKSKPKDGGIANPESPRSAAVEWLGLSRDLGREDDEVLREQFAKQNNVQFVLTNRKGFPTAKFRDYATGCVDQSGQLNLKGTILSLLQKNKATKRYTSGVFGFGGSTAFWHCNYSVIISRPQQSQGIRDAVGWTIVRQRPPEGDEKRKQFEYLIDENSECPIVEGHAISAGVFLPGSYVAHVEYDLRAALGTSELIVTGPDMMFQRMRYLLFNPVMPFWIEAVDAKHESLEVGQARTIYGNLRTLNKIWEKEKLRKLEDREQVLLNGTYRGRDGIIVRYWVFNIRKGEKEESEAQRKTGAGKPPAPFISGYLETWYRRRADPIVLTINGQTHFSFPVSTLRQFGLQLLENYLLIQIDLDEMGWEKRRDIFDQIASTRYDLKEELQERLLEELGRALGKDNQPLWAIVDYLVERILSQSVENNRIDKLLKRIIFNYESRRAGQGERVLGEGAVPATGKAGGTEYKPKYIPTKFEFDDYPDPFEIGVGSKRQVRILTDAPDDILDRETDQGKTEIVMPGGTLITAILSQPSNGVMTLSLVAANDVSPGTGSTVKVKLKISQGGDPVELETGALNLLAVAMEETTYEPVDPPTFLRIKSFSDPIKLKRGRSTSIALEFDGPDDIFDRDTNRGGLVAICTIEGVDASSGNLAPHNGTMTRFVNVPESVAEGTEGNITFRLTADGTTLEDSRHCIIEEPKERAKRYGEPYSDEMAANFEAHWVKENDENWKRLLFTPEHVARAESLPNGKLVVWVNWDNSRLRKFYRFRRERVNEADAKLDVERYRLQLAYYAYQRNKQNLIDTDEEATQKEYQRVAETTMIGLLPLNQVAAF